MSNQQILKKDAKTSWLPEKDSSQSATSQNESPNKKCHGSLERLFRIGGGIFLTSITSTITWLLLGLIVGNTTISEVYSLTYPMQYVSSLLISIFGTGANIKKEKQNNANSVGSGQLFGFVASLVVAVISVVFANEYINFFSFDVELFRPYTIYFFLLLFVQTNFNLILEKLYFEDKEKLANLLTLIFNLLSFSLIVLLTWSTKNFTLSAIISASVMFVFWLVLAIWQFKKFKLDFNILPNIKFESTTIINYLFMFTIYFFGFLTVSTMGETYIAAFNFVTLCTDAQWDSTTAVKTVAKIDISKNRFEYRKLLKNTGIFVFSLVCTTLVMGFSLFSLFSVSLEVALAFLAFEVVDFFIGVFSDVMFCVTQLQFSYVLNTSVCLGFKVVRILISCLLLSPFCTSIGQLCEALLLMGFYLLIRFKFFKVENGNLMRKNKIEAENSNKG